MKYRDYKIGFTYEVPDYFSEVRESSYEIFNVAEDTLHYFIQLDDDGEIIRNFSMGAKGPIEKDKDVKIAVDNFIDALKELGYVIIKENILTTDNGRKIYRYVLFDDEIEQDLAVLVYLTQVKDHLVTSSCLIEEYYDSFEQEMFSIFNSFEDM